MYFLLDLKSQFTGIAMTDVCTVNVEIEDDWVLDVTFEVDFLGRTLFACCFKST